MLNRYFERFTWVDFLLRMLQIAAAIIIVIGIVNSFRAGSYTANQWATLVFAGLAQGSIYALIALGYTLVYGILLMINFAHGEIYMAGALSTVFLAQYFARIGFLNNNPFLAIVILILFSAGVSTFVAVLLERIAYRPLRNAPRLIPLITAIGASFALQYTFRGFYGAEFRSYPEVQVLRGTWNILGFEVIRVQPIVFLAALLLMAILYWYVERTKAGKAMRAVSEDKDVARLMGIDIDKVIVSTFALGGALAGAAGVFNGLFRPQGIYFLMGFFPGIKAFTAAVLGGIGNIPGAMVGGMLIGLMETWLSATAYSTYRDAVAFAVLILILLVRPAGIMGTAGTEKV
jgi:branched-chain amino acid transport system permease protein